jgi:hypothetical protein
LDEQGGEQIDPKLDSDITRYLKGRYVCSMQAMWYLFSYKTYPATTPPVRVLKVKTEQQVLYASGKGLSSDLLVYFARPAALKPLK